MSHKGLDTGRQTDNFFAIDRLRHNFWSVELTKLKKLKNRQKNNETMATAV